MLIVNVLESCPFCQKTIEILNNYNLKYKLNIVQNNEKTFYKKKYNMDTFPQIFIDSNKLIKVGGYNDLINILNILSNMKENKINIESLFYFYKTLKI